MHTIDRFMISYLVPEILMFEESQHHTTTKATVKIVMSSGLHVDQ